MARQIGLSAYRLEIKKKHARNPWIFGPGTTDGFKAILTYLQGREALLVESERVMKVANLESNETARWIDGMLVRGEGGSQQEVIDVKTKRPTYTKKKSEAVMESHYFRFELEDGRPYGIVLLQAGSKGELASDLSTHFGSQAEPLTAKLTQIVNESAIARFAEEGKLQDVILINKGKTQRSREALAKNSVGGASLGQEGYKIELRIRKAGGFKKSILNRLLNALSSARGVTGEVHAEGMKEIDDFRVVIQIGGRSQTFSLLRLHDSPIRFDITSEVTYGKDGNPTLSSLREAAIGVYEHSIRPLL